MYSKEIAGFQSLLKIYYVPITGAWNKLFKVLYGLYTIIRYKSPTEQKHHDEQTRTMLQETTRSWLSLCGGHSKGSIQALTLFNSLKFFK
jgi:hypothetical protein